MIPSVVSGHMRLSRLQALVNYWVTLSHWTWTSLVAVRKLLLEPDTHLNSEQTKKSNIGDHMVESICSADIF